MLNERVIFDAASQISDREARRAYVEQMCLGNAELLSSVQSLLQHHDRSDSFLEVPIVNQQIPANALPPGPQGNVSDSQQGEDESPSCDLGFLLPSNEPGSIGRLGHFEAHRVLGQGAFGIVLKAFDSKLERAVAIKVIQPQLAATSPPRKRFLREARAAAAIRHENIVQVYTVEEQPLPFLVMEYIDGQTLQHKLDGNGPLEIAEILHLGRQIANGLAAAHAAGLIHRDIKPGNILIEQGADQRLKITDFGLARAVDDASLTSSGAISGTPMYMAPEQAFGHNLDCRSDLFSLGSVLYQMASGRPPFRADSPLAVLRRVTEDTPRALQEILPEIPDWLVAIITQLHAKRPADRIQSAKEVADLFTSYQTELQRFGAVASFSQSKPAPATKTDRTPGDHSPVSRAPDTLSLSESRTPSAVPLRVATSSPAPANRRPANRLWLVVPALITSFLAAAFILLPGNRPAVAKIDLPVAPALIQPESMDRVAASEEIAVPRTVGQPVKWPVDAPPFAIAPFNADQAKSHQLAWAKYLQVPVEYSNSINMKFTLIPPGEFLMGSSPDARIGIPADETPKHTVRITRPFYLGVCEVTQAEFQNFGFKNHSYFQPAAAGNSKVKGLDNSRLPVECISLLDTHNFAVRLSQEDGRMYRLPTEAEWEFACRAGTTSHFNWGDTPSSLLANFNGQARTVFNPRNDVGPFLGRTEIVGAYPPNAFGLHDMHGNVAELCADLYLPSGYQMESTLDPQGASKSDQRVARGGGPGGSGMFARSAARMPLLLKAAAPDIHAQRDFEPGANLGFRLLLEIAVPK